MVASDAGVRPTRPAGCTPADGGPYSAGVVPSTAAPDPSTEARPAAVDAPVREIDDVAVDAAGSEVDDVAVLVPVKSFRRAKVRLGGALDPDARRELAMWMAGRVLHAARPLPVFVACDDDDVADWAAASGSEVLWSPGMGLNGAVDAGVATIAGKGFEHVVISHGDLPLARSLSSVVGLVRRGRVVLVPDRRNDGTNVLGRPCSARIPASYGAGSFRRHLAHALGTGCAVTVRPDAELSIDLDTVADLRHPAVWPVVAPLIDRVRRPVAPLTARSAP